jgi:release factor glutamine methyltransferase
VVQHEPHAALFVPDANPLVFYEALARFGAQKLHAGGAIYAEIHEAQGKAVVQLFKKAMYADVQLRKDMQGKDRLIKAVVRSN